jgi:Mg2+ and Co2+ transporter CorA
MTAELRNDRVLNFEMLQDLRHLQSKFIPIPTMIDSLLSTLESIQRMNKKLQSIQRRNNRSGEAATALASSTNTHITAWSTASEALTGGASTATPFQDPPVEAGASTLPPTAEASTSTAPPTTPALAETSYHLTSLVSRLKAYRSSAEMHQKHIENMTKFLADTLNIKNQEIAAESNKALVKLTHDTVDDSSTVKTITFITLVYLPASFISGLFGMNLVKFGDDWNFNVSNQWWLYLPAVAIVMVVTWCFWKASVSYQKRKKREREAEEEEAEREKMGEV